MKRLTFTLIVGAPLLVAAPQASAADARADFEVMPPGSVSCASWIRGRDEAGRGDVVLLTQEGIERAEREGWVSGYITALNIEILPVDRNAVRDLTVGIDRNGLMASIDDYCAANPLHSLLSATESVSLALANDWLAAHPPSGPLTAAGARLPTAGLAIPDDSISPDETPPPSGRAPSPVPFRATPAAAAPASVAPPLAPELRGAVAANSGSTLLQIGAYRSHALAQQAWDAFRADHSEIMRDLSSNVETVDLGARGVWYRLRIGPFADTDAADFACAVLKARGADCFLAAP